MRVLLVLLLLCSIAKAETGISYLGLCNPSFPCGRAIKTFHDKPLVTGWLEGSFGAECKCALRVLRQNRQKTIRVHLTNGPCMRNRRCGPHEYFYGLNKRTASRKLARRDPDMLARYRRIVLEFQKKLKYNRGGLTCYVSPCLECDLSEPARRILFRITSRFIPNCMLVDNVHSGTCLQGKTCEYHGDNPRVSEPCLADLDGTDGKAVDLNKYFRDTIACKASLYWEPWMNCIRPGAFIDPIERDCRYSQRQFNQVRRRVWS